MSKFLVDLFDGNIKSNHDFPLNFSISGHYVFDVPDSLKISANTDSVIDLEAAKIAAFKALHSSLPNSVNDELITSPNVDSSNSTRFTLGINKRTKLFQSGGEVTTSAIIISSAITTVFIHYYGFTTYVEPAIYPVSGAPPPDRLLYNYDTVTSFQEFNPSTFTVEIIDAVTLAVLATLTADKEQPFVFAPGSIRLRFKNNDTSKQYHLSDWILLFD